ncbi:uncharacterized protein LOC123015026 [Tribolium madens]|uniref:uncharacterized protein LOC123015026 n=1 Tax=Tribolium madens TaxID=41895 RepID=UPI001CF751A1|nr:uncharacterized protein LOC123015026 [Tribolium madens]
MLNYYVHFTWNNGREMASWPHIEKLYEMDDGDEGFKMIKKLADEHVLKKKIKKMKVKNAAQVFYYQVQDVMRGLIKNGNTNLPPAAIGTAKLFLFMNKLVTNARFD